MLLSSTGENFIQLLLVLVVFVVILIVTYYTTKWIAGYQKSQGFNKNLQIVETIKLTPNKYVQLIEAGKDHYYVIAVGKDEITLLGELSSEDLKELPTGFEASASTGTADFQDVLDKFKEHLTKK